MSDKKCFLDNCNATIEDCAKPKCKCLDCLGKNKDNCELLYEKRKAQIQQLICDVCKKHGRI